jgi:ABC-type sugar transport system ATPase subunit
MDPRTPVRYWGAEELQALLEDVGFEVHRHLMVDVLPYPHVLYVGRRGMTTAASPILLHAERLTAGYGKMAILHDVTLDVRAGEMVSVIGPNGAGKSTAFKTIVGFLRPTSGRVLFDGQDVTGLRPDQVLPRGLAYVPQGRIVFPQMTVLENLEMGAYIERDGRRIQEALERVYRLFPILAERRAEGQDHVGRRAADGHRAGARGQLVLLDGPR